MTRKEFYAQNIGERKYFLDNQNGLDAEILIPITNDGFEALLEIAASVHKLPVDDKLRKTFAGYVHHIANHIDTTTISAIARILRKSVANDMTWEIDQAIKLKNAQKTKEELEVLAKEQQLYMEGKLSV